MILEPVIGLEVHAQVTAQVAVEQSAITLIN